MSGKLLETQNITRKGKSRELQLLNPPSLGSPLSSSLQSVKTNHRQLPFASDCYVVTHDSLSVFVGECDSDAAVRVRVCV